jgi:nucleotide-binding universal stress UspA family protein
MLKIERILCPVDFSEFSVTAYDYAQSLAQHYGSKLFLEHVVLPLASAYPYASPESFNQIQWDLRGEAEKQLQKFAKSHARNGTEPERVVHEGLPIDSILSFVTQNSVDLIVMGTHGYRGLDRLAMGSVTEKILRKARCLVLVVRKPVNGFIQPSNGHDPVNLRKILFCTDFSENSDRALAYALSLALEYNSELTLLHVLEDLPNSTDLPAETARVVRQLEAPIPPDARNWCTIKSVVRIGKTYQEIIQLALEAQTDLVIMGVRGRNALDLALFGSTTHRVIQLGSSPVLAVHI